MEMKDIAKQMIEFNKTAVDNSIDAMGMVHEQMKRMSTSLLSQVPGMPEEGKKAVDEWMNAYQSGREQFKKTLDESYKKVDDIFKGF